MSTEYYEQCEKGDLQSRDVVYIKQSTSFKQVRILYGPDEYENFVVEDAARRWELHHYTNLWKKREVVKRKGWVNVYHSCCNPSLCKYVISNIYPSMKAADEGAAKDRLDCVEIEWKVPV